MVSPFHIQLSYPLSFARAHPTSFASYSSYFDSIGDIFGKYGAIRQIRVYVKSFYPCIPT